MKTSKFPEISPSMKSLAMPWEGMSCVEFNLVTFSSHLKVVVHLWLMGHHLGKPLMMCFQNEGDREDLRQSSH